MENTSLSGQIFQWRSNHPTMKNYVNSILRVTREEKDDPGQPEFPEIFIKVEEGEHHLDEAKPPEWMNVEIKTNEFNISNGDQPVIARFASPYANLLRRPFSISLCRLEVPFCKSQS
jgi:hypothetical protein